MDRTYDFSTVIAEAIIDKLVTMTKLKKVSFKSIRIEDKPKPENYFSSTGNSKPQEGMLAKVGSMFGFSNKENENLRYRRWTEKISKLAHLKSLKLHNALIHDPKKLDINTHYLHMFLVQNKNIG